MRITGSAIKGIGWVDDPLLQQDDKGVEDVKSV